MRLLIAEDELDLAEALTVFFEKNHFTVDAVHNGFDAYEYAAVGGYDKHDRDKAHPRGCHRDIFRVLGPGRRNGLQRIRDGERPAERHAGHDADQARTGLFASLTGNGCVKDFTILPTGVMPHDYATLSDLFTFTVTLAK